MALDYLGGIKFGSDAPDFPEGNGITGFFSGFASGEEQKIKRRERKQVKDPTLEDPNNPGSLTPDPNATPTSDQLLSGLTPPTAKKETASGRTWLGDLSNAILGAPGMVNKGADPLFDVRKLTAEQSAKMKALDIAEALQRRQNALESRASMMDFGDLINEALQLPNPADAQGPLAKFRARHPALFETEEGKGLWKQYTDSLDLLQKDKVQERLLEQYKMQYGPDGTRLRVADLNAQTALEKAKVQAEGAMKRTQIMAEASIERAEILAGVQRDNAKLKTIRDRAGDTIYRSFLVQASAIKDSIDLTDAQKQAQIQALEDEYLGRLRDAGPAIPVVPLAPAASDELLQGLAPATNAVTPPASGNKRIIYRPK